MISMLIAIAIIVPLTLKSTSMTTKSTTLGSSELWIILKKDDIFSLSHLTIQFYFILKNCVLEICHSWFLEKII